MNIDRLKYFAAVVEIKNLRKAAELVGIAPGSMSKAISVLAAELGVILLRPEGRGIEITADGLRVYKASVSLLEECRRFSENLTRSSSEAIQNKLRFGTFEVFSSYFMSSFLAAELPDRNTLVLELTPGEIEEAVADGLVEYGLTYLPSPRPQLDFIEVGHFEMGIFGLKKWQNHPFEEWPFAIPMTDIRIASSDQNSLDMWPVTLVRKIKYEFEMLETALQTTRNGLSVLHAPAFIAELHNRSMTTDHKLVRLPAPKGYRAPKKIKIFLVVKKGSSNVNLIEGKLAHFLRTLK